MTAVVSRPYVGIVMGSRSDWETMQHAAQKLDALGYTNIYDLGGILSWPYEIEGDFEGHF